MKILFYSSYYYPYISGLTTYPSILLSHLSSAHQITALTFRYDSNLNSTDTIDGVKVVRMPFLFKLSKGFISPQSLWFYFRYLLHTDIIFINLPNAEGLPLVIMAKLMGKPVVSLFHCQVTLGPSLSEKIISYVLNKIVLLELALSRTIIGYTKDYASSLRLPTSILRRITYLLPPVTVSQPSRKMAAQLKSKKGQHAWLGFAGRLAREKGIEIILDAYHQLPQSKNIQLIFAGPFGNSVAGEGNYYKTIKNRLDHEKIPYLFLGTLAGEELAAFYQAIDILILPSTNQTEAFGMVQVEAMLAGTPVIASDLPGVRQPILLTGMGEIVPKGDSAALAQACLKILNAPTRYQNQATQNKARQIFNSSATLQAYDKLL